MQADDASSDASQLTQHPVKLKAVLLSHDLTHSHKHTHRYARTFFTRHSRQVRAALRHHRRRHLTRVEGVPRKAFEEARRADRSDAGAVGRLLSEQLREDPLCDRREDARCHHAAATPYHQFCLPVSGSNLGSSWPVIGSKRMPPVAGGSTASSWPVVGSKRGATDDDGYVTGEPMGTDDAAIDTGTAVGTCGAIGAACEEGMTCDAFGAVFDDFLQ